MINPSGMSGEASWGEERFCVQTEFAPRPKPRITTSISLNGEVVEKVENVWDKLPQSEEDKDEIERFLRKQHRQVIEDIREKGSVSSIGGAGKNSAREEKQNEGLISKVKEVISISEGITGCVLLSNDDRIIGQDTLNSTDQTIIDLTRSTNDLASSLSSVSKVGNLVGGVLKSEQMRMVFIPIENNFLAFRVNPDVNVKGLVQRIKSASQKDL